MKNNLVNNAFGSVMTDKLFINTYLTQNRGLSLSVEYLDKLLIYKMGVDENVSTKKQLKLTRKMLNCSI